jgi:cytochrome c peroxidase
MTKLILLILSTAATLCFAYSFRDHQAYGNAYASALRAFSDRQQQLLQAIEAADLASPEGRQVVRQRLTESRLQLKSIDFWLRYLDPIQYRRINGPLPVEWETEVFEKFEPPYRRDGAGLTLAELYLQEETVRKDSLRALVEASLVATHAFAADSNMSQLQTYHHFFLANRLFLLNLASIYTTGFECPSPENIVPELRTLLSAVRRIYGDFNQSFPATPLPPSYLQHFDKAISFAGQQPADPLSLDHFRFIRDYVNPLFRMNAELIRSYAVVSGSYNDYSLNDAATSIFDKELFRGQHVKGIFSMVNDEQLLEEIRNTGKLLFYDPILSGNNQRSCASCHKPQQFFTDTAVAASLQFDRAGPLSRNTPSLVNAVFNHLLMLDGKHISLQAQAEDVLHNAAEMNSRREELVQKVLSCRQYKDAFRRFLRHTPEEKEVTLSHITSALTWYYAGFSGYYAPFDEAMNSDQPLSEDAIRGFNLFMGKAQCGTCHFVPQFSGVKPPFIGSEFEVLGVPADQGYRRLSADSGRYRVHPAAEMLRAFRTGTVRNAGHTQPYMHNGVFSTLQQVIDFYDGGGGAGRGLAVPNQTLSADSLRLT